MKQVLETWKRSPLLRVVVPMMGGVLAADVPFFGECVVGLIVLVCAWFFMQRGINRHWSRVHYSFLEGIFYALLSVLSGVMLVEVRRPEDDASHVIHQRGTLCTLAVRLEDEPKATASGWRVTAQAMAIQVDSCLKAVRGRVSLFLSDSTHQRVPHVDDCVWVQAMVQPLAAVKNPGEFDYARYNERQGIFVSVRAREHQWIIDSCAQAASLRGCVVRFRERLIDALESAPIAERERHVLAALVLGKTAELDAELMQAYAAAGAVHVLAVSGLHVALIYLLLKPLFSAVFGKRRAKCLRWSIPVTLLWLYAALTGFSPSVLRAALMFSCFIVGETYGRTGNIFNTMSASVIILLLVDPMVIYSMGFILSYLAVLGIVILQPPLRKLWAPEHFILKKAWELVAISVAAQVATMPVTLYLFHQFPTWFIATNLVVVPLSTLVLYTALAFFALLWWTPAADFVGGLLGLLTRLMNDTMTWSATWPYALIDGIYWIWAEFMYCVLLVITVCLVLLFGVRRVWIVVISLIVTWVLHATYAEHQRARKSLLCFFCIRNQEMFTYVQGGLVCMYWEDERAGAEAAFQRTVKPFIDASHAQQTMEFGPSDWLEGEGMHCLKGRYSFEGVAIARVDSLGQCFSDTNQTSVFWFTRESNRLYLREEHLRQLKGATVILGNTYARKKREWLKKQLGPSALVLDVSESAVMLEDGRWVQFGQEGN